MEAAMDSRGVACSSGSQLQCVQQFSAAGPSSEHQVLNPCQLSAQMLEAPTSLGAWQAACPALEILLSSLLTSSSKSWCAAYSLMEAARLHIRSLCTVGRIAITEIHWQALSSPPAPSHSAWQSV